MRLEDLKFDNANNACLSLHVLAELVRRGEVKVVGTCREYPELSHVGDLAVAFGEPER